MDGSLGFESDSLADTVRAAKVGNPAALNALMARHLPALRTFIRLNADPGLRARESAADLVQATCLDVLRDLPGLEYRGDGPFRSWLFTVALNKIRDRQKYYARGKRRQESTRQVMSPLDLDALIHDSSDTPSQHAMLREDLDRLERAFDELPSEHRAVLSLSKIAGISNQEIAAQMGVSTKTVRTLLHRAMARLGSVLDRGTPDP